jgi:AcrR family transcriptional regulator
MKPSGQASAPATRREYTSPLRAERAADTRRRIAAAALELFAGQGFADTTVAAIAERAGVSAQTVYATFGTKGAIIGALLSQLEDAAGAAEWRARIAGERDPRRKLAAFAAWTCAMLSTSRAVIAAAEHAASDPAIQDLRAQGDRHRRQALEGLVSGIAAAGALQPGLSKPKAVDRAWMLTGVELYFAATAGCGWPDTEYTDWLAGLLCEQLLARDRRESPVAGD